MTIGKQQRQTLPIETEAYKKEVAAKNAQIGATETDPKKFPKGTPKDVKAVTTPKTFSEAQPAKAKTAKVKVQKLPPAKAQNSETTADVQNPRKGTTTMKTAAKKAAKAPAKKAAANGEGRGRTSHYSGKTLVATAEALKTNPRREGTAGFKFMEVVRKAGKKGIKYEDLRAHKDFGNNHLAWDVDHGNIVAK